jgi:hypothetical protein
MNKLYYFFIFLNFYLISEFSTLFHKKNLKSSNLNEIKVSRFSHLIKNNYNYYKNLNNFFLVKNFFNKNQLKKIKKHKKEENEKFDDFQKKMDAFFSKNHQINLNLANFSDEKGSAKNTFKKRSFYEGLYKISKLPALFVRDANAMHFDNSFSSSQKQEHETKENDEKSRINVPEFSGLVPETKAIDDKNIQINENKISAIKKEEQKIKNKLMKNYSKEKILYACGKINPLYIKIERMYEFPRAIPDRVVEIIEKNPEIEEKNIFILIADFYASEHQRMNFIDCRKDVDCMKCAVQVGEVIHLIAEEYRRKKSDINRLKKRTRKLRNHEQEEDSIQIQEDCVDCDRSVQETMLREKRPKRPF